MASIEITNMGQFVFLGLGLIMGAIFIGFAINAIRTDKFSGPKKIVYGTPTGVEYIDRRSRPFAFWFCVIAFLLAGVGVWACVLLTV